jgi:hypothetical protein
VEEDVRRERKAQGKEKRKDAVKEQANKEHNKSDKNVKAKQEKEGRGRVLWRMCKHFWYANKYKT